MHLNLELKPLISIIKISRPCVTLITPGATLCIPCSVGLDYSIDGLMNQVFQHDCAWLLDLM